MAGPEQIGDRILNFMRNEMVKGKLYRKANLNHSKSQEVANIMFNEPDALLLSPAGTTTRGNSNTVYAKCTG